MKFSTNKIIIIVVIVIIAIILFYFNKTTEYFTFRNLYDPTPRISPKEIKKRVSKYIGYSNGIMRDIVATKNISILQSINITHTKLIKKLFIIKHTNHVMTLFKKYPNLNVLNMYTVDEVQFEASLEGSGPYNIHDIKNDIGTALLRINKINNMLINKIRPSSTDTVKKGIQDMIAHTQNKI